MNSLIEIYWQPCHRYIRLHFQRQHEEAEDLVQGFFAALLEQELLARYDGARGSFRSYLRTCLDHFVLNNYRDASREKRGGGKVVPLDLDDPASEAGTPEEIFYREWQRRMFGLAIEDLRQLCEDGGRQVRFRIFADYDLAEGQRPGYDQLAQTHAVAVTTVILWKAFDGMYFCRRQRTLSERLSLFEKICEAVAFAHNRGVVHRDLKPENVMIGPFGEVVVLDWGVAIWKEADPKSIAGTPRWMAPEQAAGGPVDRRTDVYALGLMLKETIAEGAPRPLTAIAAQASSLQAEARYASVELMLADLRRYHDQLPVLAYRESAGEKAIRFAARNHVLLLLLATYVAVRVLLFFL